MDTSVVLVIDDSSDMCDLIRHWLTGHCGSVETAGSLADAVRALDARTPDLVLLDIDLGPDDGFTVHELLKSRPELSVTPTIFLTGSDSMALKRQALLGGAVDYLVKPVDPAEFRIRVRVALDRKQRMEDLTLRAHMASAQARLAGTERLALAGELARGLIHELASPMTALMATIEEVNFTAQSALQRGTPAGMADALATVDALGRESLEITGRINVLIRELRHVARPAASLRPSAIDPRAVVGDALRHLALHGVLSHRFVDIRDPIGAVAADREDVFNTLIALLDVASEAPEAATSATSHSGSPPELHLLDRDGMIGIAADSPQRPFPGSWMAAVAPRLTITAAEPGRISADHRLLVVATLLERNRGHLEVLERAQGGTRFVAWLPAWPAA